MNEIMIFMARIKRTGDGGWGGGSQWPSWFADSIINIRRRAVDSCGGLNTGDSCLGLIHLNSP